MFGRLISRTLAYLAIGVFLSLVWVVVTDGATVADLRDYAASPSTALTLEFWPVVYWLIGGLLVVLTASRTLGDMLRPSTWSRQLRRTRELERQGIPRAEAILTAAQENEGRRGRGSWRRGDQFLAVLFTDMSGSTQLNEQMGDARWAKLVADHRSFVRDTTKRHGGAEVNTQGDGFFMRFDDPGRAVDCAIAIQRGLDRLRSRSAEVVPPVRIGIHCGLAIHDDHDVLGQVVNIGARLMDIASGDDILVTEPVVDRADLQVPLEDRGLVPLKGLAQPRHVMAIRWRDGVETEPTGEQPRV
ncbi:MAG: adenylate/guanylate cyclase domain-containing protein [Acidimicrobiia bacterium]|nr:adenylate/guanylate cyclase domain-containing protein [Acidimicrobiia bacterium]